MKVRILGVEPISLLQLVYNSRYFTMHEAKETQAMSKQGLVRDSENIFLQLPGKRDSPNFKHGMWEFLPVCWEFGKSYVWAVNASQPGAR